MRFKIFTVVLLIMVFINSMLAQQQAKSFSIHFNSDQFELDADDETILKKLITATEQSPYYEITLTAHTDSDAEDNYNETLSMKRASSVMQYLLANKVSNKFITKGAYGERKPKSSNKSAVGKAKNRRVDIVLNTYNIASTNDLFKEILPDYKQQFSVLANQVNTIKGKNGTTVNIPANAIVTKSGKPVTGKVNMVLEEYLNPSDAAFNQLSTVSNGKLLESGGMFKIKAFDANGEELVIKQGNNVQVLMPTINMKNGMSLFTAVQNANGITEWMPTNKPILPKGIRASDDIEQVKLDVKKINSLKVANKVIGDTASFVYELPKIPRRPGFSRVLPKLRYPKFEKVFNWRERLFYPKKYLKKIYNTQCASIKKSYDKQLQSYLKAKNRNDSLIQVFKEDSLRFENEELVKFRNWLDEQKIKHQAKADYYERAQWNYALQNLIDASNNNRLASSNDYKKQFLSDIGINSYMYGMTYQHKVALALIDYYQDLSLYNVSNEQKKKNELTLLYSNTTPTVRSVISNTSYTFAQQKLEENANLLTMLDIAKGEVVSRRNSLNRFNESKVAKIYQTSLSSFGTFNCDRFSEQPQNSMATINIPFDGDAKVAFFVPSLNSYMYAEKGDAGYYANMPKGTEVKIIFVAYDLKQGPLLCIQKTVFNSNTSLDLKLQSATLNEVKSALK